MNTEPREAASPKYVALLAAVSLLILVVGFRLKPDTAPSEPIADIPQAERSRLHRLAQRASLDSMTDYFLALALDVESHLVRLDPSGPSGIVWDANTIVTARVMARFPDSVSVVTAAADVLPAVTTVSGPHLQLAAAQVEGARALRPARRTAPADLETGQWLLAVWRDVHDRALAPGHFLRTSVLSCGEWTGVELVSSLPLSQDTAGGGVFDLDGHLLAVILPCGGRYAAVAVGSVEAALRAGSSEESRLLVRYGMRLALATGAERVHFNQDGLLVKEVWRDYPADAAGLAPGDLIVTIDGEAVGVAEDVGRLLAPPGSQEFDITLKRGRREIKLSLAQDPVDASPADAPGPEAGIVWESPPAGHSIVSVQPDSPAAVAGIRAGDRLLRLDHAAPRSLAHMRRSLSRRNGKPTFVELERAGRRWGVLLPGPQP